MSEPVKAALTIFGGAAVILALIYWLAPWVAALSFAIR